MNVNVQIVTSICILFAVAPWIWAYWLRGRIIKTMTEINNSQRITIDLLKAELQRRRQL